MADMGLLVVLTFLKGSRLSSGQEDTAKVQTVHDARRGVSQTGWSMPTGVVTTWGDTIRDGMLRTFLLDGVPRPSVGMSVSGGLLTSGL